MSFIEVKQVSKEFDNGLKVLNNISMDIGKGEFVTLLGSSGCGKTTLLRCIAGFVTLSSGQIYIDGTDVTNAPPKDRDIGMVFQQYSLFPNMTAAQNIAFGLKMRKTPSDEISRKVREIIEIIRLEGKENSYPAELSGGQQQRVALARALVTEPKVLLLDEPLSAIDALIRKKLQQEIRRIQRTLNITTIFVTHDQHEAMVLSDRIFLMNEGKIAQSGSSEEIYTSPESYFAATFVGNYNVLPITDFERLMDVRPEAVHVAIRPELCRLSEEFPPDGDFYVSKVAVRDRILNGTTLSYSVEKDGVLVNVELLNSKENFLNQNEAYLYIPKDVCVCLAD